MLAGSFSNYIDAYFEAMSGFTTTGATVMTSIESQSHGILLWRNLTQWLGGMGIMTFFIAFGPVIGIGVAHLFEAEIPGPQAERLKARIRSTAQVIWIIYACLSGLEILLLKIIARLPFFDAFIITLGTMPTGGFLHKEASIAAYNGVAVSTIVTIFMLLAGVNFGLYYYLWHKEPRRFFSNIEFRLYIVIMAIASMLIVLDLSASMGMPIGNAVKEATFQAASIQTTTGFVTADFDAWPSFSRAIILVLMIIGASAGSTGGALKVIRIAVLVKYIIRHLHSVISPKAVLSLRIGGNVLPEPIVTRILGVSVIYFASLLIGFVIMTAIGLDLTSAFSAVAATLGNVGPGLAAVGPVSNYASVPYIGKIVLILCMLVGRLEFIAVLVLIVPTFWSWR
jgi:trk system potassium uptake protein TrkH